MLTEDQGFLLFLFILQVFYEKSKEERMRRSCHSIRGHASARLTRLN